MPRSRLRVCRAHVLLGALVGSLPVSFGGVPKAPGHFDTALKVTGRRFLTTHVLYAAIYAVQVQGSALFERLLEEVRGRDLDPLPERRLTNAVLQQLATRLARRVDELLA